MTNSATLLVIFGFMNTRLIPPDHILLSRLLRDIDWGYVNAVSLVFNLKVAHYHRCWVY